MPFGFSKKDKDAEEDTKRSALFGSRSKNSKAAPAPQANPYAVQGSKPDPYAAAKPDPYTSKPPVSNEQLPAYDGRSSPGVRNDKSPVPPGGYGGGPQRFGGQGSYGQPSGYGSNPYGNEQPQQQSRYGPSGYGGLGRANSQDTVSTDAGRNALFGDAPQRAAQQPASSGADNSYSGGGNGYDASSSGAGAYGSGTPGGYGSYDNNRELTAEEQEEEDVKAAKSEIKFIKQQDVASTRNARRIAEQAEATGRETLARLGQQGERIHNTERNLDMASNQNRLAEEKARELKTLNRSMFAVHVANPFTAKSREAAANALALDKHQKERMQSDATRAAAYSSQARQQGVNRDLNGNRLPPTDKASLAQRSKYQFEADSEDDEMENEIDG